MRYELDSENWGAEEWRKPSIPEDAVEIFSEYGRIIPTREGRHGVDYRSTWLLLFKYKVSGYRLRVKHGAGEETFDLGFHPEPLIKALAMLTSDERYEAIYTIYRTSSDAEKTARQETATYYKTAFYEKRLKVKRRDKKIYVEVLPRCDSTELLD